MAMDAILATIADGGQAMVDMYREVGRHKLITCLNSDIILNLQRRSRPTPRGRPCVGFSGCTKNPMLPEGATASPCRYFCWMCDLANVGLACFSYVAIRKRGSFIPTRMDF